MRHLGTFSELKKPFEHLGFWGCFSKIHSDIFEVSCDFCILWTKTAVESWKLQQRQIPDIHKKIYMIYAILRGEGCRMRVLSLQSPKVKYGNPGHCNCRFRVCDHDPPIDFSWRQGSTGGAPAEAYGWADFGQLNVWQERMWCKVFTKEQSRRFFNFDFASLGDGCLIFSVFTFPWEDDPI